MGAPEPCCASGAVEPLHPGCWPLAICSTRRHGNVVWRMAGIGNTRATRIRLTFQVLATAPHSAVQHGGWCGHVAQLGLGCAVYLPCPCPWLVALHACGTTASSHSRNPQHQYRVQHPRMSVTRPARRAPGPAPAAALVMGGHRLSWRAANVVRRDEAATASTFAATASSTSRATEKCYLRSWPPLARARGM
jgi:hypothetical protein